MAFFNAKKKNFIINLGHVDISLYYLTLPFATSVISVSDVTTRTKMEVFFRIGTKSDKNKI